MPTTIWARSAPTPTGTVPAIHRTKRKTTTNKPIRGRSSGAENCPPRTLFYENISYQNHSLVRHVGAGALTFALLGVMACLLYIAFNKSLDMESAPKEND